MKKKQLSKKKQELLDFLGDDYQPKMMDFEATITLDLKNYDVEITGGSRSYAKFDIYVWRKDTLRVVKTYEGVRTYEEVKAIMEEIKKRYK